MGAEPFAYAIQAPIGSVVPLFHRRKDAEDYIAKLTDSRDEAKIIPLYRAAPALSDVEREVTHWRLEAEVHQNRARAAVGEIGRLREAIRRLADQDATLSVQGGNVIVEMDAALTDAEREAVECGIQAIGLAPRDEKTLAYADTLQELLERTKNG